jgi:hypothetical protein
VSAPYDRQTDLIYRRASVAARDWQGLTRHYYAITFGERYIWGVTAGILRNLHERVYGG